MTSQCKNASNRLNARASTGPKTARGKARASQNARRHGLTLAALTDPMLSKEIKKAAKEIAGRKYKNDELLAFASRIAEAQIDLWRAREARHQLFVTRLTDPYFDSTANAVMKGSLLAEILAPEAPNVSMAAVEKILNDRPQGAEKFAVIITDFKDLRKLDRYERRARSRRKFAIRAFDEAVANASAKK